METGIFLPSLVDVLAEVQELHWVNFLPGSVLKVLIRDLAITILVKVGKYLLELILGDKEAPIIEKVAKFNWLDCPRLFLVEVRKRLLQRLPLELDLLEDRLLEVHLLYLLVKHALVHLLIALVDNFNVLFILGVAL
jgi:hypothetical protein